MPSHLAASVLAAALAASLAACVTADDSSGQLDDDKGDLPDVPDNPRFPSGSPTVFPIVLVHGFASSPSFNGLGPDIVKALCSDGHAVFAPQQSAFASAETRAAELFAAIEQIRAGATDLCGVKPASPPAKVNLIAHSMGGLDARVVASHNPDKIASVITISTPHRGSFIADRMLAGATFADEAARVALGGLIGRTIAGSADQLAGDLRDAFVSLAESSGDDFEARHPADVNVVYNTWAGLSNAFGRSSAQDAAECRDKMSTFPSPTGRHIMAGALAPIAFVVGHFTEARPNDGLVTIASARWDHPANIFRGCIPADHADEVGAFGLLSGQWDHVRFVRNRAFELADFGL
jgi:triacylglycerol lipase